MQVLCEEGVSGTQKVEDKLKSVKTGEKCPRQRAAAGEKMEERRGRATGASYTTPRTSSSILRTTGELFVTNAPHQFKVVIRVKIVLVWWGALRGEYSTLCARLF